MKDQILKIAGVKSEKEFYKKYPTEAAFKKAHPKAFKKAEMGASMVKKQLTQLTDFSNPPQAQAGFNFGSALTEVKAGNVGMSKEDYQKQQQQELDKKNAAAVGSGVSGGISGGIGDMVGELTKMSGDEGEIPADVQGAIDSGFEMKYGGDLVYHNGKKIPKAFGGLGNIAKMIGGATEKQGGLGSAAANLFGGKGAASKIMNVGPKGALGAGGAGFGAGAGAAGLGILDAAPQILGGVEKMKEQKAAIKKADQMSQISGLTAQAAESRPEAVKNKYVRPEDQLVQPGQMGSPQGTGTNFLAQYGASIGGNPTEIQNTYNPGDLYSDLGYEPLNDSNVKQFAHGGNIPTADFGDYFQESGQASIGKGVGSAIGSAFLGPIGGKVGGFLGGVAGNLLGGAQDANRLARYETQTQQNTERAAWQKGGQAIQSANASFMKDGGYMNPEYNPQVISKFGDYSMNQLLKPPYDADMLRAGGHLKEYTPPSAQAMQTYEYGGQMAMGGDLQTHWGGYMEPISNNPYLPGGGMTYMPRGQSHDETNGKGQSGIGITYGDNPVEVERGEPIVKLEDGGTGDNSLTVFGNMVMPKYALEQLQDPKAKGMKFKNYANDLSKSEAKQNRTIDKAMDLINIVDANDPFEQLTLNAGRANLMGANKRLQNIAAKKTLAAGIQNAILDTAREHGLVSDELAKGKIVKDKETAKQARFGAKMSTAQSGAELADIEMKKKGMGTTPGYGENAPFDLQDVIVSSRGPRNKLDTSYVTREKNIGYAPIALPSDKFAAMAADHTIKAKKKKGKFDWENLGETFANAIPSLFRGTDQEAFDPSQIMGEQFALASNQLEPVQAQQFQPMLDTPYDISLQDQLNEVDAQARAATMQLGANPAAAAMIFAQAADAKNKIRGEQMRINQAQKAQVYGKNREIMNQAQLQNLGIMDQQYVRQATAKSKTKEEALNALNSISSKIAQHKLENKQLGLMENMYNFRFGPQGQAINVNDPYQFTPGTVGSNAPGGLSEYERAKALVNAYDAKVKSNTKAPLTKRNGAIVNSMKTLKPL